jgi:subtilisin family serine protease
MKVTSTTAALAAAGMLLALAAPSAQAAQDPDTYIAVATGASAMSVGALEAAVESTGATHATSYGEIRAVVADMTATEAAALDAKPGVVVSKDAKISLVEPAAKGPVKAGAASVPGAKVATAPVATASVAMSWGLDRVDQRPAALNSRYDLPTGVNGAGAHAWVFDTGIAAWHPEFAGRVGVSYDFVGDGNGTQDCNGHGTHVSGTIGSTIFGVAPKVTLHAVRILDCAGTGYWSWLIEALNAVAQVAPAASVANVSTGGYYDEAVNAAVNNFVVAANMPIAVAAGNSGSDVTYYSPASATRATTVAASEIGDWDAPYSNYGEEIDLYGPGTDIWSTYYADPALKCRMSGTSMATPHVTGYMALYLSIHPTASVAQVEAALTGQATRGAIRDTVGGTPNRLVYTAGVTRPRVTVAVASVSRRSKLFVNVNPDRGSASWVFRVQRLSGRTWVTKGTYTTQGPAETRTINLKKGTYRVVVPSQHGYLGRTSRAVYLRR